MAKRIQLCYVRPQKKKYGRVPYKVLVIQINLASCKCICCTDNWGNGTGMYFCNNTVPWFLSYDPMGKISCKNLPCNTATQIYVSRKTSF